MNGTQSETNVRVRTIRTRTPLLFISVFLLLGALCAGMLFVFSFLTPPAVAYRRIIPGVTAGVLLLSGIVLLIVYLRIIKKKPELKPAKAAVIVLSAISAVFVAALVLGGVSNIRTIQLNQALQPKFPPSSGEMILPDEPKFLFYNGNTHWLTYPDKSAYPCAASSPEEANVYVILRSERVKRGEWVEIHTGKKDRNAYRQKVRIEIQRADDGTLYTFSHTFSRDLTGPYEQDPEKWSEVISAVNEFMKTGAEPSFGGEEPED